MFTKQKLTWVWARRHKMSSKSVFLMCVMMCVLSSGQRFRRGSMRRQGQILVPSTHRKGPYSPQLKPHCGALFLSAPWCPSTSLCLCSRPDPELWGGDGETWHLKDAVRDVTFARRSATAIFYRPCPLRCQGTVERFNNRWWSGRAKAHHLSVDNISFNKLTTDT